MAGCIVTETLSEVPICLLVRALSVLMHPALSYLSESLVSRALKVTCKPAGRRLPTVSTITILYRAFECKRQSKSNDDYSSGHALSRMRSNCESAPPEYACTAEGAASSEHMASSGDGCQA